MILRLVYILLFFSFFNLFSQEKEVYLVEEKQKKRTILYIQNDTDKSKSVFLKIKPIGYRKSAHRPIIKNIPSKSKVQILILIPLKDVTSSYTYDLVVNEDLENIDIKRSQIQQNIPKQLKDSLLQKQNQ